MNPLKFLSFLLLIIVVSCSNEQESSKVDSIKILLPQDPERLNPVYDPRSIGREVFQYMHLPIADYHPEKLTLFPILIEEIPSLEKDDKGSFYQLNFKKGITWNDGKPITTRDYEFTIKSVLHPETVVKSWKPYMRQIKGLEVLDEHRCKVYIDDSYMLSLEITCTPYLLPYHSYENADAILNYNLEEIKEMTAESNPELTEFVTAFNDPKNFKGILGNGPYILKDWITDQMVSLEKTLDHWGVNEKDNPFVMANVNRMEFKILADELAAITAFKDGEIDIINGLSAANFKQLDEAYKEASYLTSPSTRLYYLALNNKDKLLKDPAIRKALAALTNVQTMINNIEFGYGVELTGPIHPDQDAYNEKLSSKIYDPQKAKEILEKEGWKDTNADGTIDKIIDGKKEELVLDLLITGSELGKKIALLLQDETKKLGIGINIVPKDIRRMRKENLYNYNYDIAALASSMDLAPIDPYRRWHSDNIDSKGNNVSAYSSPAADSLITLIRKTKDTKKRERITEEFHELIYNDQPVIFLFAPNNKIAVNKNFIGKATSKRPGYLANTFKVK